MVERGRPIDNLLLRVWRNHQENDSEFILQRQHFEAEKDHKGSSFVSFYPTRRRFFSVLSVVDSMFETSVSQMA